jgi:hypothetical protein
MERISRKSMTGEMSRKEFMTAAAGMGLLAGCAPAATPGEAGRQGTVIAVTRGPEDPDRVMLALVLGTFLPEGDHHVWFTIHGGPVCKSAEAERISSPLFKKFGSAADVFATLRKKGVKVHI